MLVLNGGNFMAHRIGDSQSGGLPTNTMRNINGDWNLSSLTVNDTNAVFRQYRPTGSTTNDSGVTLICGSGTSAVSETDYQLGNAFDDTEFTSTGSINFSNGKLTITGTFINVSGMDKTITEIGVIFHWKFSTSMSNDYLIARVLVPSRTVGAGETATFTYEVDFTNV